MDEGGGVELLKIRPKLVALPCGLSEGWGKVNDLSDRSKQGSGVKKGQNMI